MNYQKITLIGKVTMDAKKKRSQDGAVPYTTFTVAVRNGKNNTTFFPVMAFSTLSRIADKFVKHGTEVLVEGQIRADDYAFIVSASRLEIGVLGGTPAQRKRMFSKRKYRVVEASSH